MILQRLFSACVSFILGVLLFLPCVASADPLDNWHLRNPCLSFNAVTYGNDTFVAVGPSGIYISSDGVNWIERLPASADTELYAATYGNGIFVTVGSYGKIFTSTDGVTWTPKTSGTSHSLLGVTYGNGIFVAVGYLDTIITSTDGVTWTPRTSGISGISGDLSPAFSAPPELEPRLNGVTYGNGIFVAVGGFGVGRGKIVKSHDGVNWISSETDDWLYGVTYGNGTFVAVGYGAIIITSTDGVTWTLRTSRTSYSLLAVTYGNGTFVAVGDTILTSSNGVNWSENEMIVQSGRISTTGVTYGNGTFVAVGRGCPIWISSDAITWSWPRRTVDGVVTVTYGNNMFLVVGVYGEFMISPDTIFWTVSSNYYSAHIHALTYGNGTFVAVGDQINRHYGKVLQSTDGINWTQGTSDTAHLLTVPHLYSATYGNGQFVAAGESGTVLTSPYGANWTVRNSGTTEELNGVTCGRDTFIAVGSSGIILTSSDGINWIVRSSGITSNLNEIAYGNGTYAAVGSGGTILTSPDGLTWTVRNSGTNQELYGLSYANGTFVAVGSGGTILTSPDGLTWNMRDSGTTLDLNAVAYGNGTFIVMGSGMILQSDSLTDIPPLTNNPPTAPTLVYPTNSQAGLNTTTKFIWKKSVDIDGDPITYNLYICEDQSFTVCSSVQIASVNEKGVAIADIVGCGSTGLLFIGIILSGRLWRKKRISLLIVILIVAAFFISCGGGGSGGKISPTNGGPPPVGSDELSQTASGLKTGVTYYWKVVADDGKGGITGSDIWSFSIK